MDFWYFLMEIFVLLGIAFFLGSLAQRFQQSNIIGYLLAGAILTETIFSWPGIGKWMVDSIFRRDYPVVQGGLLLIALIVMIVNLTVDVLYGLINPKIRSR